MSVIPPVEGNETTPTGGQESPTSAPSSEARQPLPDNLQALDNRIAEIEKLVKGVQKGTDKQIGQIRTDVKRILELQGQGLSETQIERELAIDSILQSQTRTPQPETPVGNREQQKASLDLQIIDELLELPANDSRVTKLKLDYGHDARSYKEKALELKRTFNQPPPSPAEMPLPQGSAPASNSPSQLKAEYENRRNKIAQEQRGDAKIRMLSDLKVEYRQKGLDI